MNDDDTCPATRTRVGASPPDQKKGASDPMTPKKTVEKFMQTWRHAPLRDGLSMVDPDGLTWISHAGGATGLERNRGTEFTIRRWLELLQPIVDEMPGGLEVIAHRVVADGDWVVVDTESLGTVTEVARYNMRYTFWFEVRTGRIVQLRQFFDSKYGEQFFANRHFEA